MAVITAAEIETINDRIGLLSKTDPKIAYGVQEGEIPSRGNLRAIVEKMPRGDPIEQAAWLLRALILVQPFPDGNHRTGVAVADLVVRRSGKGFRSCVEAAQLFQRSVSSARRELLGGYDDAPLAVLDVWEDEVMRICREFVRGSLTERA